jgi:radical SAM superfamily enzyme YgiQ (UPF0313 family)
MADILIAHCNHLYFDRKQERKMQPYPPRQAMLAAACLRRAGFSVALFDSTLLEPEAGFAEALAVHAPRLVFLCEDNFNFLTKMCLTRNRELAFHMARLSQDAGVPVVAAGSDVADRCLDYLRNGVGFAIAGEVEATICELTESLLRDGPVPAHQVAGTAWRDSSTGQLHINARRAAIEDLDSLPLPAWDLIDADLYREAWLGAHGYFSLNIAASRGCPYRCNWCAKPVFGSGYRCASPQRIAEELSLLKRTYRPDQIWFADDIFALSPAWAIAFADAVETLDARIPFKMQSRVDLMTRPTVAALASAGCAEVWMGAESGSQKVLDAMDKGIRVEQIGSACRNLRSHGIRACLFLQFGYPGETWNDILKTIHMVRETRPDDVGISVAYPLPGTRFYEQISSQLGSKRNWEDSDDLAMMFQGPYTSDFYRALRDAVHLEVSGSEGQDAAWSLVEAMEKTSATERPTVLWTCS